jgi:hypothetical protein
VKPDHEEGAQAEKRPILDEIEAEVLRNIVAIKGARMIVKLELERRIERKAAAT